MKKLSVILLALALTFSLAAVAAAANFDPYLGGEFQVTYDGTENEDGDVTDPIVTQPDKTNGDWARFKMMLTGTVEDEETGTWAKIGCKLATWGMEREPIYEAGIKDIGGVLDIWYNGHEYENAKRGQIPIKTNMAKFGGDPLFKEAPGNVFAADYNSGNVRVNFGVDINKDDDKENNALLLGAGTFSFDAGEARVAFQSDKGSDVIFLVGGAYDLDFGTIEVDYLGNSPDEGDATGYFQAAVSLADLGLKGIVGYDNKAYFPTDGGYGFGVEFTGIENVVLGAKMLIPNDDADKNLEDDPSDITDIYAGYNFGVFETRLGVYKASTDADNVFYAAAHVGMW